MRRNLPHPTCEHGLMPPLFVLIHSPLVGPATWQPVADALARRGHPALVPSLLHVADAEPPAWRQVAAAVAAAVPGDRPVVLVAHSNAGAFVPVIRQALGHSVARAGVVLPGGHLTQLVDREGVTEVLVNGWPSGPQPRRLGPARRGGRRMDPAGLAGGRRARPRG